MFEYDQSDIAEKLASLHHPGEKRSNPRPPSYGLVFHDDNYTPASFVLAVMLAHAGVSLCEAHVAMLERKTDGYVVLGRFSREVAEHKVLQLNRDIRDRCFPLRVGIKSV